MPVQDGYPRRATPKPYQVRRALSLDLARCVQMWERIAETVFASVRTWQPDCRLSATATRVPRAAPANGTDQEGYDGRPNPTTPWVPECSLTGF